VSLIYVGASFVYMPRSDIAGSSWTISIFLRTFQVDFLSGFTSLQSQEQWTNILLSLHPCQHLLSSEFLTLTILTDVAWNLIVILICISLMTKDVEHVFMCFTTIFKFYDPLFVYIVNLCFYFYCIFYVFIFQMRSPYPVPPSPISPPSSSMRMLPLPPTHSYFNILVFPYNGKMSLHRTKGFSSYWFETMASSAICELESRVTSCVLFGWWFSPWEFFGGRGKVVDMVVLPRGLQSPSAPSVLSQTPPLESSFVSVRIFIWISRVSQEAAISVSCQEALLGISNGNWVWWLHLEKIPWLGSLWMAFPLVSAPLIFPVYLPMVKMSFFFLRLVV